MLYYLSTLELIPQEVDDCQGKTVGLTSIKIGIFLGARFPC
jgi:hypothetical protein